MNKIDLKTHFVWSQLDYKTRTFLEYAGVVNFI